jgi:hypothetical protein
MPALGEARGCDLLFLFVNQAVIGFPGLFGFFYDNNSRAAKVTITQRQ